MTTADILPRQGTSMSGAAGRFASLFALTALADFLIFARQPGINVFLFANAVTIAILLFGRKRLPPFKTTLLLAFSLLASAPLLETPSSMGLIVSLLGIACVALSKAGLVPRRLTHLPLILFRFLLVLPLRLFQACSGNRQWYKQRPVFDLIRRHLRLWIMPLGLASGFLLLFTMANPLIETALRNIDLTFLLQFLDVWRIGFWLAVATFVCAMLRPHLKRLRIRRNENTPVATSSENGFFGHASLLRSLLVFNALFAMQTLLDLAYLWGDATLPDGMSHAEYAHRGAYPLIVTALLAAVFVLIAMRRGGPGDKSPLIRGLVHLWIAQNILLCLSSILRLDLYVEVYSLTELRVAAGIWMGLVAVGLFLILLRIMLNRSNDWLVTISLMALTSTFYTGALIDIPSFIARFNVAHSKELSGQGAPLDLDYLRSLGQSAIPVLDTYLAALPAEAIGEINVSRAIRNTLAADFAARPDDWRSWTFRDARLATYLQQTATIAR